MKILNRALFILAASTLLFVGLFFSSSPVNALSNWEPHEADYNKSSEQTWASGGTQDMRFVTDMTGAQAWKSVVAIYTRTTNVSITIKDAVHCSDNALFGAGYVGGDYDGGGYDDSVTGVPTVFSLEPYSPAAPSTIFGAEVTVTGCNGGGSRDITLVRDISSNPQPVDIGGITWYRSKLRADMSGATGGSNTFEVKVNNAGGLVSYYSQSGNDFVLQDRGAYDGGSPPRLTDYHLKFGTECTVTSNTVAKLSWYDDDRWGNNSDVRFNYRMELIERTRAGALTGVRYYLDRDGSTNFLVAPATYPGGVDYPGDKAEFRGNQVPGEAFFTAKPDHTYEWIWHGVQKNNAVQFQLPYDSIYYEYGCPTDEWNYTIDVSNPGNQAPGDIFDISSTVTNGTTVDGADPTSSLSGHRIFPSKGEEYLERMSGTADNAIDALWQGWPAIKAGKDMSHQGSWKIKTGPGAPPNNTEICFKARVSPSAGDSSGITAWSLETTKQCFTVDTSGGGSTGSCDSLPATSTTIGMCSGTISWGAAPATNGGSDFDYVKISTPDDANGNTITVIGSSAGGSLTFPYNTTGIAKARARAIYKDESIVELTGVDAIEYPPCKWALEDKTNATVNDPGANGKLRPGSSLTFTAAAKNTGDQTSPEALVCAAVISGGENLQDDSLTVKKKAKIDSGDTLSGTVTYNLQNNVQDNKQFCVRVTIIPTDGTWNNTNMGPYTHDYCYTTYNKRFDFINPGTISLTTDGIFPGDKTPATAILENNNAAHLALYPGATGSASPNNIKATLSVISGPASVSGSASKTGGASSWGSDFSTANDLKIKVDKDAKVGDQVCVRVTWSPMYGYSDGYNAAGNGFEDACFIVADGPYMQVENGDIWAGANFSSEAKTELPPSCGSPHTEEIRSRRSDNKTPVDGLWRGSLVEYAALATGSIAGFGSGVRVDDSHVADAAINDFKLPDYLTFANDTGGPGKFTDQPRCIPNYYELMKEAGESGHPGAHNVVNVQNLDSGQYYYDTPIVINSSANALDGDKDITLVTSQDIFIRANGSNKEVIFDDDYGTATNFNIPSLVLVAKGNIYIDQNITEIDGILISHGTIWTCAKKTSADEYTAEGIAKVSTNKCNKPLLINGALIANQINFMRTHGTKGGVHDVDSEPSEIINFTPEFFLSDPIFMSNVVDPDAFRAILTKDLPPIY